MPRLRSAKVSKPRHRRLHAKSLFHIGHSFGHVLACDPISGGECLQKAKEWLEECLAGHPNYAYPHATSTCSTNHWHPTLPTRVICLEEGRGPYLVESKGASGRYAALSYCWGAGNKVQTTSSNIGQHKREIRTDDLPKTLRDAVTVARYLSFKYLWIDALVGLLLYLILKT